jgi:serine phosphatase RsbU (regulator of sigma subunit)
VETRQEEAYITAVLLQVAQAVVSQNDLNDVLDTIIHLMPILVGIETCAFYIWDKKEKLYLPAQSISTNHSVRTWLKQNQFSDNEFVLLDEARSSQKMAVSRSASTLNSPEIWRDLPCIPLPEDPSEVLKNSGNWLLAFPLTIKSEFYGVMLACENEVESSYSLKRLELLNGVAQQISLAIQDDRLKQEMIGRERMEQEIQLARQIQRTFLPDKLPRVKDWTLDLRWNTAREVGGDFYDVFHSSDKRLAFAIADVSDKGMPAALYMTVTRTLIHSSAQSLHSPAKVLKQVNQQLMVDTQNGMFITAVFGFLNPITGEVDFAIAGHNLPLIYRANKSTIEILPKGGMAMGVLDTAKYEDMNLILNKGDVLLLYTDGVTETFSPENEIYGDQRLLEDFLKACQEQPENILGAIEKQLKEFRKSDDLSDDMTMLIMQRQ